MCGRMNVSDHPGVQALMRDLGIPIYPKGNSDYRPTQLTLALILNEQHALAAEEMSWGIQPPWAKQLLINAKAETVQEKKTFASAFKAHRCLIPCTGWYEWKEEDDKKKAKYLFTHPKQQAFLMAGIWFSHEDHKQFVTLTTEPNSTCAEIHHRMPVMINKEDVNYWFNSNPAELTSLLDAIDDKSVCYSKEE